MQKSEFYTGLTATGARIFKFRLKIDLYINKMKISPLGGFIFTILKLSVY